MRERLAHVAHRAFLGPTVSEAIAEKIDPVLHDAWLAAVDAVLAETAAAGFTIVEAGTLERLRAFARAYVDFYRESREGHDAAKRHDLQAALGDAFNALTEANACHGDSLLHLLDYYTDEELAAMPVVE